MGAAVRGVNKDSWLRRSPADGNTAAWCRGVEASHEFRSWCPLLPSQLVPAAAMLAPATPAASRPSMPDERQACPLHLLGCPAQLAASALLPQHAF